MRRADRRPLGLALALAGLLGLGCALGLLAQDVLAAPLDRPVLRFVVEWRAGWLTSVMLVVTNLGAPALLLVVVIASGWVWWNQRGTSLPLVMLLSAWLGAELLFNVAKVLVDRTRPPTAMAVQHFGGLAFPSGHATQAAAVWGTLAALVVLSVTTRGAKLVVCVVAMTVVVVVGVTRIYLGAHWTTDVLGGWLLGGLWAAVVVWLAGPRALLGRAVPAIRTTV